MKTHLFLHQSEDYPMANKPTYEELEGRITILEKEVFDLRQKKGELSGERELLKFRFRRRTLWLLKIIDQLNAELEKHKRAQEMEHPQVHEI
jgi:hypothetical protein